MRRRKRSDGHLYVILSVILTVMAIYRFLSTSEYVDQVFYEEEEIQSFLETFHPEYSDNPCREDLRGKFYKSCFLPNTKKFVISQKLSAEGVKEVMLVGLRFINEDFRGFEMDALDTSIRRRMAIISWGMDSLWLIENYGSNHFLGSSERDEIVGEFTVLVQKNIQLIRRELWLNSPHPLEYLVSKKLSLFEKALKSEWRVSAEEASDELFHGVETQFYRNIAGVSASHSNQ